MTTIRDAKDTDAEGCLAIYAPIVRHTTTSFETEVPTVAEFAGRIRERLAGWAFLVAETPDGDIAGYAYGSKHRGRTAYQWSAEVSVYVDPGHHRGGLGRALYAELFDRLRARGYANAYAGVTLPNDPSVGFHAAMGFTHVGVYDRIGFKHGAWHSVSWWQLRLQELRDPPPVGT